MGKLENTRIYRRNDLDTKKLAKELAFIKELVEEGLEITPAYNLFTDKFGPINKNTFRARFTTIHMDLYGVTTPKQRLFLEANGNELAVEADAKHKDRAYKLKEKDKRLLKVLDLQIKRDKQIQNKSLELEYTIEKMEFSHPYFCWKITKK